jgi:predicted DNA-binding protein (MmcQ/YjbR family)
VSDAIYLKFQAICLKLPEAAEKQTWDVQTFRVREKIFAMFGTGAGGTATGGTGGDDATATVKAPPGAQQTLVGADPERFYVPPYVGPKGWVGIRLDDTVDWAEIEALMVRSYRLIAPKRLAALI